MEFNNLKKNLPKFSHKAKKSLEITFGILFGIFILSFLTVNQFPLTGKIVDTEGYKITPLSTEQKAKIEQSILSSEFLQDIPKDDPVFLRFFTFESGERVWQDGFLINSQGIITEGEPTIYFSVHSKYISEFNNNNLCEIVEKANKNGDVGLYSDYSKLRLLIKYASMLKHRDCLGL